MVVAWCADLGTSGKGVHEFNVTAARLATHLPDPNRRVLVTIRFCAAVFSAILFYLVSTKRTDYVKSDYMVSKAFTVIV